MLAHLRNTCKKYPSRFDKDDKSQSMLSFEVKREGQMVMGEGYDLVGILVITKYNAAKIRKTIAKMIIKDELTFRFVEGEGFQDFLNVVEPRFSIHSRHTVM
jgi:hypothetical protein